MPKIDGIWINARSTMDQWGLTPRKKARVKGQGHTKVRVRSCIDAFRHVVFRQWHDLSELNLSVGFIT